MVNRYVLVNEVDVVTLGNDDSANAITNGDQIYVVGDLMQQLPDILVFLSRFFQHWREVLFSDSTSIQD